MRLLTVTANHGLATNIAASVIGRAVSHNERVGLDAIQLMLRDEFDALVIDSALTGVTGLDVIRKIRARGVDTPIMLMLDANVAAARTEAFSAGADDVMPKPFDGEELAARLSALVRRCHGHSRPSVPVGAMVVDFEQRRVFVNGGPIDLTAKEYEIVELLALRRGKVLSKQQFMNHLYGGLNEPEGKIIDVFICKLRKKLAQRGAGDLIATVRGSGYVLREPVAPAVVTGVRRPQAEECLVAAH